MWIVIDLNQTRRYVLAGPYADKDEAEREAALWAGITRPLVIANPTERLQ